MTPWIVVLAVGAGSFGFRVSMLLVAARFGIPPLAEHAARHAVPVSFAVIAMGGLAERLGAVSTALVPLLAVTVAITAVRRTGSPNAALLAGMPVVWILSALFS